MTQKGLSVVRYLSHGLEELRDRLNSVTDQPVTVCVDKDAPVVHPDTPMLETLLTLYRIKSALGVVDEATGRLLGMVSYFDVGERITAAEPTNDEDLPRAPVAPATGAGLSDFPYPR